MVLLIRNLLSWAGMVVGPYRTRLIRSSLPTSWALGLLLCWSPLQASPPLAGFQPLVGIGLTDEFDNENAPTFFQSRPSSIPGGTALGAGGVPYYDLALLDTGAAVSLVTQQADSQFDIGGAGFRGTELQQIGGATGTIFAAINDPLGLYAAGLADRIGGTPLLTVDSNAMQGQINTSLLTLPAESDLPNVLGLSFASQYATFIRNDQPQIFQHMGKTIRSPQVDFLPLGSGGQGILRRAPLELTPSESFLTLPSYVFNFLNVLDDKPLTENPMAPTNIQGGLFVNIDIENDGQLIDDTSFFFDTGADVTVVSELNAVRLGFDPVLDEPQFTIPILGSGGTTENVPGFFVDQLTILTIGGTFSVSKVPVIVLDVADPSQPGNIVPGILGTNLFAGRNLVIDPNPAIGGGGVGPSLYISDPVTTTHTWNTVSASGNWSEGGDWDVGVPDVLGTARVTNPGSIDQQAILTQDATVFELVVSGESGNRMTVRIDNGVTLTTYSGATLETGSNLQLLGGTLDAQFVEVFGGTLTGNGVVKVGNGTIVGQVENRGGVVAPGDGVGQLTIEGRFSNATDSLLQIELGGANAGSQYDQMLVDGPVTLAGTLQVDLVDLGGGAFVPAIGNMFEIITATDGLGGQFESLILPSGINWYVKYGPNNVLLQVVLGGDFDADGEVDVADLSQWQIGFADGTYTGSDFIAWQQNLGMIGSPLAAVPEPSGLLLVLLLSTTIGVLGSPRRVLRRSF